MYTNDGVRRTLEAASNLMLRGDHAAAADAYLRAAEGCAVVGRAMEALAIAFTALKLAPSRFVALAVSGLVHKLGPQALPLCKRAVALHLDGRRTHDATALLELLVHLEPRDCEIRVQLAELYARTGRRDAGLQLEMSALRLFESDGNNRDILAVGQHMLSLDASHRGALRSLIRAHLRLAEFERAMRHASILLSIEPSEPVALEAVARILVHRGDPRRGLDILRQLVSRLAPADAAVVLRRARRWNPGEDFIYAIEQLRQLPPRGGDDEIIELSGEDLLPLTG